MNNRTNTRSCKAPKRYLDEVFLPGANNKFTEGRAIDASQDVEVESDDHHVGDFRVVDTDFIVGDDVIEEEEVIGDSEEEKLSEDSEEEESEDEEWEDDDDTEEDEYSDEEESGEE